MIEAIIFDMDGTLVDSETLHFEAWKQTLQLHGIKNFPFSEFISYVGASNEKLAADYIEADGLGADIDQLVDEKQLIYLDKISDIKPLGGVVKMIKTFVGTYRLAVASSSDCIELEKILRTLNLRSCFEQVVGGDMVTQKKPAPEIYLKTADLLSLAPDECVAVEDSESGLVAAKEAGLFVIAVPNALSRDHDFSRADRVVERMDQINKQTLVSLAVDAG